MKKNMGTIDKMLRILVAAIIVVLFFLGVIEGTLAIVLLVFAGIFVLTSLISVCPLYPLVGMDTTKKK
jgi:hypothetical protein